MPEPAVDVLIFARKSSSTSLAVKLRVAPGSALNGIAKELWMPRSCVRELEPDVWQVPLWLANKNGLQNHAA